LSDNDCLAEGSPLGWLAGDRFRPPCIIIVGIMDAVWQIEWPCLIDWFKGLLGCFVKNPESLDEITHSRFLSQLQYWLVK